MATTTTTAAAAAACLCLCLGLLLSPAAAAPPGLWFWGGADPKSLGDIAAFQKAAGSAAPAIYYAVGGFSMAGGKFGGEMNVTKNKMMSSMGIKVQGMISTSSIKDLRTVFEDPTEFIADAVKGVVAAEVAGINLDWEPYAKGMTKWTPGDGDGVLNKDGFIYATFLDKFGKALHAAGKELSLDFFSNLAIWNLPAMNASAVDTYIDMDTYVQDNQTEAAYVAMASAYLDPARFGALSTLNCPAGTGCCILGHYYSSPAPAPCTGPNRCPNLDPDVRRRDMPAAGQAAVAAVRPGPLRHAGLQPSHDLRAAWLL
eukprot:SAG22_NODE_1635_length_3925_cov_19.715107_4_plen_314_part_00